jgi:hypothetical protein
LVEQISVADLKRHWPTTFHCCSRSGSARMNRATGENSSHTATK